MSHLLQMRGLKPLTDCQNCFGTVASFTDAWIETVKNRQDNAGEEVASFTDAWIETPLVVISLLELAVSHLLQMRGLKL